MIHAHSNKPPSLEEPRKDDIIFFRGSLVHRHFGNVKLCALVKERGVEYVTSSYRDAKDTITRQVVEELSEDGGRFLQETGDRSWEVSKYEDSLRRIHAVFEEYASTMPVDSRQGTSNSSTTSSPKSPATLSSLRFTLPTTVTPPDLSPQSSPLQRRQSYSHYASHDFPPTLARTVSAASAPSVYRDSGIRQKRLELARLVLIQKQNERRRLLQTLQQQERSRMSSGQPSTWTTSQGKRRQIDPLAPHRKRKTPRVDGGNQAR